MKHSKAIDVVVHGATGYTGQLICEYLATRANDMPLTWAISGRNQQKLAALAEQLPGANKPRVIVADSLDTDSVDELAASARVVIAVAGPYLFYGEALVCACANNATDYVDLAGEAIWIRSMIEKYQDAAKATGSRIVHSCGFDSIPSDLGIFKLQQLASQLIDAPFKRVKGRVDNLVGGPSGGTIRSILASVEATANDERLGLVMQSPYALCPGFDGPEQPNGNIPKYDEELGSWNAAFIMAEINTKNVHRTNMLLNHAYSPEFLYDEMVATGPGSEGEALAQALSHFDNMLSSDGSGPQPGEGPTREERENGSFTLSYHGIHGGEVAATVRVSGSQDPGYGTTSRMIVESALCLLLDDVQTGGGIWSAASCMGDKLTDRLEKTNVLTFDLGALASSHSMG